MTTETTTEVLNQKLAELKVLEDNLTKLTEEKDAVRKEVLKIFEEGNIAQYKNEVGTISRVEKKTITFVKDKEEVLKEVKANGLDQYITVVPEVVVAEHLELNKSFDEDVKGGVLKLEGVEVKTTLSQAIRFNK